MYLVNIKCTVAIVQCVFNGRCDSTEKLKCKMDDLRGLFSDPVAFKNIFRFAYDFAKVSCWIIIIIIRRRRRRRRRRKFI